MKPHKITFGQTEYDFFGEPNDPYFIGLPEFNQDNRILEAFLSNLNSRKLNCVDIGANIGLTAVLMAHFSPDGKVFAFEPGPYNFKNLNHNIATNKLTNLFAFELAIGAEKGFVNFNIPNCGAHSTVLRSAPANSNYTKVEIVTLDDWVQDNAIDSVDVIKIDVEGFEPEVLRGAVNTIIRNKPYIYMEFNSITTIFEGRVSPLIFAEAIWKIFKVFRVNQQGQLMEVSNARDFTYENILQNGCIDNIMLKIEDQVSNVDYLNALAGI